MENINVHIYPSNMINESRMFKESRFISKNCDFEKIILLGIWEKELHKEELFENNITIKRVSLLNVKKRVILYLYYYLYVLIFIIIKRPNMINIHTLEFLPLSLIAKIFKIKVIYDTHELETEKNNLKGFRKKISKIIERVFIGFVDKVIVVGESIADEYKIMYPWMERPTVVLNTPNYKVTQKNDLFREKFNISQEQIIFLYQGEFGYGRNMEKLIEIFANINDKDKVIVFMGFGGFKDIVLEASKKNKNIYFHEAVSPSVLLKYTSSADIGISAIENTSKSYNYCMPNKMFEYVMAGIPVMVTNLYEMSSFVKKNKIGVILANDSKDEITKTIYQIDFKLLKSFKNSIENTKLKYCWDKEEEKLFEVYKDLI